MKTVELGISGESDAYIEVRCRLDSGRIECFRKRLRALQKLADLLKTCSRSQETITWLHLDNPTTASHEQEESDVAVAILL
jgi:hypothetical protein